MSEAGVNSKNPAEAAKAEAKANKKERRAVNAGTQVGVGERASEKGYVPRFKQRYNDKIKAELMTKFGYTNVMQVPNHWPRGPRIRPWRFRRRAGRL